MYLQKFDSELKRRWKGTLFSVENAQRINERAKEYLYRLNKSGMVKRVYWGWYYIPEKKQDVWSFLRKDQSFKVIVKQTAASFWNYDFVHRNVYRLIVENPSYKKALEEFAKRRGWIFEVECYDNIRKRFQYKKVDGLLIETPESCLINCIADWSFLDAFAVLYFRRKELSLKRLKELGRWKRISKTNVRVWNAIKYGCNLFNQALGKRIFDVRKCDLRDDIKELITEAIEKVVEFV